MSAPAAGMPVGAGDGWGLWVKQAAGMMRLELRRIFRGKGSLFFMLLPLLPLLIPLLLAIVPSDDEAFQGIEGGTNAFLVTFQTLVLPGVLFVGCTMVFTSLVRKEVMDRTLHYLLLTPVRREVIAAGKFVAGWAATAGLFTASSVLAYFFYCMPYGLGATVSHLFTGYGLAHLAAYVAITLLACLGYGAVFFGFGLVFKNPYIPAVLLLVWENLSYLYPVALKKLTVIHYLRSLSPIPFADNEVFLIPDEPSSVPVALLVLIVAAGGVLALAGQKMRRMEVSYGDE